MPEGQTVGTCRLIMACWNSWDCIICIIWGLFIISCCILRIWSSALACSRPRFGDCYPTCTGCLQLPLAEVQTAKDRVTRHQISPLFVVGDTVSWAGRDGHMLHGALALLKHGGSASGLPARAGLPCRDRYAALLGTLVEQPDKGTAFYPLALRPVLGL